MESTLVCQAILFSLYALICPAHAVDHEVHDGLGHQVLDGLVDGVHVGVHQVADGLHLTLQLGV